MIKFYSAAYVKNGDLSSDACEVDMTPKEAGEFLDKHESMFFENNGFVPVRFEFIDDDV